MLVLRLASLLAASVAALLPARAIAQDNFPSRAVRILVPYSVGGTSDNASRLVSEPLTKQLKQPVIVENRGGAGGLVGTEAFVKLPPDGYTMLLTGAGPLAIIPPTKQVGYSASDFVPLGLIWRSPQLLAVNQKLGFTAMRDLVAHAKANPGKLSFGSAGVGALTHLSIELLKRHAGIEVIHVPHRSTGGTLPALIGGHIDATFGDVSVLAPQVREKTIQALAIAAPVRSPLLPDLVTMAEAGYPGVEAENWYGLVVLKDTPAPVVKRLQEAMLAAQNDPQYREALAKQGASYGEPGREPLARLIASEIERWRPVVTAPGVKIE
jgi:tripartite-type tricarboxylate transporter receptor subunit TctC